MHLLDHFENFIHIALLLCYLYRQPSKLYVLDDLQVQCIFYPEAKHHQFATEAISFCPCFIIPQCKLHASKSSLQIYSLVHQVCDIIWFQHTAWQPQYQWACAGAGKSPLTSFLVIELNGRTLVKTQWRNTVCTSPKRQQF